ncbi:hypothetical protein DFH07DRAFT_948427 [Mycena maculata]|uniref:Arrestin-like N-terminal domain-containing protein n=1 Tax=Mycena maculata TaxID=230809 RepID=A0AAD7KIF1_9AGAR|nr:hypothetical protein DFH07DRAFT_948427 [Mycena maculata]
MSLLRDVLKRGKSSQNNAGAVPLSSKKNIKSYAASVKSSGGASVRSIAQSVASFYSAMTGSGPRVPKRRRADFSRLGVPEWYEADPPPPPEMPGTAAPSGIPPYTMAHSTIMHATDAGATPWLGLVLYSHAPPTAAMPMYHNGAKVAGEVRMILTKPTALSSIDVWFVVKSDSVIDMQKPAILTMTATLWNRKQGDPSAAAAGGAPFKGKFPAGTFVFPFEFPALPADTLVKHPDEERRRNKARVPLPPTYTVNQVGGFSGNIKYTVGVNVAREGLAAIDEEFGTDVQYLPLARALPRAATPFPYLPTREDWPFAREVVGGWTLTPFGGRGRLGEELVELEGTVRASIHSYTFRVPDFGSKLGIQEPAVYTAGQTLAFSLLLWSPSALALQALAQPGAIDVGFFKSDVFALDALHPKNSSRKNRTLERLVGGRVWLADAGRPEEGALPPECALVELPEPGAGAGPKSPTSPGAKSPSRPLCMQAVWGPEDEDEDATLSGDGGAPKEDEGDDADKETDGADARAPSPVPSLEAMDDLVDADAERIVRLDGEVRVPACSHPSFRFSSMAREYVLHLLIRHPQYSHISPAATGIIAEVPVWYVLNRFGHLPASPGVEAEGGGEKEEAHAALPVKGEAVPVGEGAVRLPACTGHVTTRKRPTFLAQRVAAF